VYRGPLFPRDDHDRKRIILNNLVFHFRPVRVPLEAVKYTHTWGLGGMALVLFSLLVSTGVLLMFVYEPAPGAAYDSIVALQYEVFFGKLVRNIHYWSANFLVVVVTLHLLRVYFTGGYFPPRQFNWVLGLLLFCCVLISNFTGYLLPWDQLSYWAVAIVTGMIRYTPFAGLWLQETVLGGDEVGPATLIIFYTIHTTVIPVLVIILMGFHFWRIRKARGVVIPRSPGAAASDNPERILALPNLFLREFSAGLALFAFVLLVSLIFNAPLGEEANPGMSPNPAKAPWYFMGLQELLVHFHPVFAVLIIPLLAAAGMLLLPYLNYDGDTSGIFMASRRGRRWAAAAVVTAATVTPLLVIADEFWVDFGAWFPELPTVISNGLLPVVILAAGTAGFYSLIRKRRGSSNNEAIQALFVFFVVALVVLTLVGVWFRGEGMSLAWPWNS